MPWTKYSLGASLEDGQLRLLYLRGAWRDVQVVDLVALPFPSETEEEGPFSQEIQKFILKNGVRPFDTVTFGLPRPDVLFRHLTTPPVQEKDLHDLVGFESERHVPGKREDFTVGYQLLGRTAEGGHRLMLAAVKAEVLEGRLSVLRKANLAPVSIQPSTMGLAAAFHFRHPDASPALLISLGETSVSADCLTDGQLLESRHFARPAREEGGRAGAVEEADALSERLSRPVFLEGMPGGGLPPLWLCGERSEDDALRSRLEEKIGAPVQVFSPLPAGDTSGAGFGAAFGLALLGLDSGRGGLEMSEERREGLKESPRFRATAGLALLLVALIGANIGLRGLQHHRQIGLLEQEVARMKEKKSMVEDLSGTVRLKRSRLDFITSNLSSPRQADLLKELTLLIPDDTYLSDYSFRDGRIDIGGLSPAASRLIPLLEASPLFKGVQFTSAIVSQGKASERFKIRLYLEENDG
jgi:Tfp pilus assembly PilM family ATPase/Tfp pilus assembly protein PilN